MQSINNGGKRKGEISPSLEFTANFSQNGSGGLQFSDGTGTLGLKLNGELNVNLIDNHLTARTWVSGSGAVTMGVPEPFMRQIDLNFQAGAEVRADAMFSIGG